MIRKIECVCIPTRNVAASEAFYLSLGLRRSWIIFQMEEIQTAEGGRTPGPGWAYAHGLRLDGTAP